MTYEEFKDHVVDVIKDHLPEEYENADVNINQVLKNNETLDGLVITIPGQNVSPTIYLDSFYKEFESGKNIEDILDKIADLRVEHNVPGLLDSLGLSPDDMTNYEKVKDSLIAHVVGIEGNEDLLSQRPHIIKEDLAIMYKIALNDEMSVPITNQLFSGYNVSVDELHETAMSNIADSVTVTSMSQTISEMMGIEAPDIPPEKDMIILSNESKVNGAIAIFNEELMDRMSEQYGNFLLLPSSVHESLVVPEAAGLTVEDARQMVMDVNETQVAPQDRLSNNVYMYDRESHELKICREDIEMGPEIEKSKELYRDDYISVTETAEKITVSNLTEKDIAVYAETLADTLDLASDDAVIVLYENENINWENTDRGFTGEVVSALKQDLKENNVRSAPLDEATRRTIKLENDNLALA